MSEKLTHINSHGEAHMVDVSDRNESVRIAQASGKVLMSAEVIKLIGDGEAPKGDVISAARIAGIMAAKKTSELIPLCHPIGIQGINVELKLMADGVEILATVKTLERTGVEMEALTAVSVAGLTLIDMIKSRDPRAEISAVHLNSKSGGTKGEWRR
jgi:cyclic pyranopterin phosphate synthase